jgi:ribosomal-protein-alanine acetyltransferase
MSERPNFVGMQNADLSQVVAVERDIYTFPWTRGNFADSLAAGHHAWLLRDAGAVVAYAVMMLVQDEVQLLNITVARARQRSGLGSDLLNYLCEFAASAGGERVFLEVRVSNEAALAFYSRHGFRRIGERRGYYPAAHGRENALILERRL